MGLPGALSSPGSKISAKSIPKKFLIFQMELSSFKIKKFQEGTF